MSWTVIVVGSAAAASLAGLASVTTQSSVDGIPEGEHMGRPMSIDSSQIGRLVKPTCEQPRYDAAVNPGRGTAVESYPGSGESSDVALSRWRNPLFARCHL